MSSSFPVVLEQFFINIRSELKNVSFDGVGLSYLLQDDFKIRACMVEHLRSSPISYSRLLGCRQKRELYYFHPESIGPQLSRLSLRSRTYFCS